MTVVAAFACHVFFHQQHFSVSIYLNRGFVISGHVLSFWCTKPPPLKILTVLVHTINILLVRLFVVRTETIYLVMKFVVFLL